MRPKVNIKYNRFLDPIFIFYCQNSPETKNRGWHEWSPPSKEVLEKRIENYRSEWQKNETKILNAMCKSLGLNFKRNIIDVHIVSGNQRQFSHPLVIKSGFSPSDFVDVLTHELIHILLTDNTDNIPTLKNLFPTYFAESYLTLNHILVQAVLKYIYLDILNEPKKLKANIASSKKHSTPDYSRAWEIVEKEGYLNIIHQFKISLK